MSEDGEPVNRDSALVAPAAEVPVVPPAHDPATADELDTPEAAPSEDGGVPSQGSSSVDALPDAGDDDATAGIPPTVPDAGAASPSADLGTPTTETTVPPEDDRSATPVPDDEWMTRLLGELLFDRAEREAQRDASVTTPEPSDRDLAVRVVGCNADPETLGLSPSKHRVSTTGLLLMVLFGFVGLWLLDRLRRPLPKRGLLPRLLHLTHWLVRVATVVIGLMVASRLLPGWTRPALLLGIASVAVGLGFGAVWLVLPDVVGGLVLLFERRLRSGLWVAVDGFEGTIEQVGLRLTTLRQPSGSLVTLPNRHLVRRPIQAVERRFHEVEVELTAPPGASASRIRRAIEDAVLCSPYVPSDPAPLVTRDPASPTRWQLRARLLDASFAPTFRGQLLERVEEALTRDG